MVEWGCGGGANAVHFGPMAEEFVGADVSAASLEECERQARAAGAKQFVPVLVDVREPEAAVAEIGPPCDLFLCTYVLELVPTPEYGLRILRIAADLLAERGLALVQIKYATASWRTRPRRRKYQRDVAGMTSYRIEDFWQAATECGLRPHFVQLVPRNELDERYAYFLCTRS